MTETPPSDSEQAFLDRAVVIALGSNLPGAYSSSRELLDAAVKALDEHGLEVARASSWWRSKAWPEGAGPDFLNGVALVETALPPTRVLATLQGIERGFSRSHSLRNAPRTLDLDLVAYGRLRQESSALTLPHPRMPRRLFVTGPLAEIAPWWMHPVTGQSARDLSEIGTIGLDARIDREN